MKRITKSFLFLTVLFTFVACMMFSANAASVVRSGSCGTNARYTLYSDGKLTISGSGEMELYTDFIGSKVTVIDISDGITSIQGFDGCSVKTVNMADSVTTMDPETFQNCQSLETVNFSENLTSVGEFAFKNCIKLKQLELPESVKEIELSAFSGCTGLTSVKGVNVSSVSMFAFSGCTNLETVQFKKSGLYLGDGAFANCSSLTSVITLDSKADFIADFTFMGCSSLTTVYIPKAVTYIGEEAFDGCESLQNIYYSGTAADWKKITVKCSIPSSATLSFSTGVHVHNYEFLSQEPASCTQTGLITYKCSICGITKEEITDKFDHYFSSNFTVDRPATCSTEGSKSRHCLNEECSEKTDVTAIPKPDHTNTVIEQITATCMNSGKTVYRCSGCGKITETVTEKTEHTYSASFTVDTEPTCTKNGSKSKHCIYEGCTSKTEKTVINATGHTEKIIPGYAATCEKPGLGDKIVCTKCNEVLNDVSRPVATGHSYKEFVTKATMTTDGKIETKCTKCGYVDVSKILYKPQYFTLSDTNYVYSGKVRKPYVYVSAKKTDLVKNKDFTVVFSDEKSKLPGKYKITVTLKGNYVGSKVLQYTISPEYTVIEALSGQSNSITVKWLKQAKQTTGYQIQYSTDKNFKSAKTVKIKKSDTISTTISKLKSKTTYYVRIRTYTDTANGTVYSVWSSAKKVTTKPSVGVTLNASSSTLYVGGTKKIKATANPSNAKIKWVSSDKSVATVSEGKIKALKKGTATITAYFKKNGKTYKATCKVTVKTPTIKLNKTSLTIDEGKSVTIKATATPECTVTWSTSDKQIATVKNGKITAKNPGTVKITAKITYGGKTYKATCKVSVKDVCQHKYSSNFTIDVEPTCTKTGSKSKHCYYCNAKTSVTTVKAKGHSFGDWVITIAATLEKEGVKTRTCSRCKYKETKAVVEGEMYSRPLSGQSGKVITVGARKMKITVTKALSGSEANSLAVSEYSYNTGHGNGKEWRIFFFDVEYISSSNGYGDTLIGSDIINNFGDCVYTLKGVKVSTSKYAIFGKQYRGQSSLDLKLSPGSSGKMVFGFLANTGLGDLVLRLATNTYYTTDPVTWLSLTAPSSGSGGSATTGNTAEENLTALKQYMLNNGEVAAQGATRRLTKEFTKNGYEYFVSLTYNISKDQISFYISADSGNGIPNTVSFTMKNTSDSFNVTANLRGAAITSYSTGEITTKPSALKSPFSLNFTWSGNGDSSITGTNGNTIASSLLDLGFSMWDSIILEHTGLSVTDIGFTSYR